MACMSRRLNIAHIIVRLESGGAERSLLRLIEATSDELDHNVFCLGFPSAIGDAIVQLGASVTYINYKNPFALFRLARLVRAHEPDLVQGWMYYGNVVSSLLFGNSKIPCLWNIRHSLGDAHEKWLLRISLRIGTRLRRSKIIFNSETARQTHQSLGYNEPDSVVIVNGIDTDHFRPSEQIRDHIRSRFNIETDTRWIGLVGRNHPQKGIDSFLAAMSPLLAKYASWRIALVGPGMCATKPSLKKLIGEAGIALERIDVIDAVPDTAQFLPALDCLVVASRVESFPNVALEAMACGVAVVGTDVGDLSVIIDDESRICPVNDTVALQRVVVESLGLPATRLSERSMQDRQRVQARYHMDLCAQAYVSTYQTLTQQASQQA
jgi:glycosyltransferase involved in cell wall biosynthesis